jgi:hypothetical protein
LSGGLVWILGPVVLPLITIVTQIGHHFFACGAITPQFIGDNLAWCITQALQQLTEKPLSRTFVAVFLDQDIQHITILIDNPPEIMAFAIDGDAFIHSL